MRRFVIPAILFVIIAGLLVVVGLLLNGKKTGKTEISTHTVVKEVLPIGEYASLVYRYTSVVKNISAKDFSGWEIPFTTKKYIFTYDGVIKLGIDGTQIQVEKETGSVIHILLPPVKILSHEIVDHSVEVFEQSQTIFNTIKIAEAFKVTADRKQEMEEKVMAGSVIKEAQTSMEQQLGALLKGLPSIHNRYEIVFVWQDTKPQTADQAIAR